MLSCPICAKRLMLEEKRAICPEGHSFDRARQGYWNLLLSSSSGGHGDDAEMLRARRTFLEKGYYQSLACAVSESVCRLFPQDGVLLDAGCGEGYYTQKVTERLFRAGKKVRLFAFDISKEAVKMTAGRMKKEGNFFVASTYHIPMESESADMILSLFAPYSEGEFLRVLRPGGFLCRAVPLEDHLYSLKCAVYDAPTRNEGKASVGEGWNRISEERIRGMAHLQTPEEIEALFAMTPYARKTGQKDREKLKKLTSLDTQLDFGILLTQKKK